MGPSFSQPITRSSPAEDDVGAEELLGPGITINRASSEVDEPGLRTSRSFDYRSDDTGLLPVKRLKRRRTRDPILRPSDSEGFEPWMSSDSDRGSTGSQTSTTSSISDMKSPVDYDDADDFFYADAAELAASARESRRCLPVASIGAGQHRHGARKDLKPSDLAKLLTLDDVELLMREAEQLIQWISRKRPPKKQGPLDPDVEAKLRNLQSMYADLTCYFRPAMLSVPRRRSKSDERRFEKLSRVFERLRDSAEEGLRSRGVEFGGEKQDKREQ